MSEEYFYMRVRVRTDSELGESLRSSTNPNRKIVELAQFAAMFMKSGQTSAKQLKELQFSTTETPFPRRRPVRSKAPQSGKTDQSNRTEADDKLNSPFEIMAGSDLDDLMNIGQNISA